MFGMLLNTLLVKAFVLNPSVCNVYYMFLQHAAQKSRWTASKALGLLPAGGNSVGTTTPVTDDCYKSKRVLRMPRDPWLALQLDHMSQKAGHGSLVLAAYTMWLQANHSLATSIAWIAIIAVGDFVCCLVWSLF